VTRFLAAGVVLFVASAMTRADLIPPGTRNIAVDHQFETDKDYPDWVFFVVRGSGGVEKVKLDAKTPAVVKGSAAVGNGPPPQPGQKDKGITLPYRASALIAVPKDAAKGYKTDKELHAAIEDAKVAGQVRVKDAFYDHENAAANDARKSITRRLKVTKIDPKEGIVVEAVKGTAKDKEEEEAANTRGMFPWVAGGLATAAAVCVAGLAITRRTRRG
jgi:hypothetical protein